MSRAESIVLSPHDRGGEEGGGELLPRAAAECRASPPDHNRHAAAPLPLVSRARRQGAASQSQPGHVPRDR